MEWSIQDLGAAGEFVGAIGVVITLAYLAYQIRQNTIRLEQNTLTAKAAAQNASNVALRETRAVLFASAEMAEFFDRGNSNPEDLGDIPRLRYRLLAERSNSRPSTMAYGKREQGHDPQPPFDAGSPSKAPSHVVELVWRVMD